MVFMPILSIVLMFSCNSATALKLPSYIKPCAKNDPHLNECALKEANSAIPRIIQGDAKYRIPVMDPLNVEEAKIEQGGGSIRITLLARNISIYGLKDIHITKLNMDLNNHNIDISFMANKLYLISQYEINGQVVALPIIGKGGMNLTVDGLSGVFKGNYDLVKRESNGKEYVKLMNSSINYSIQKAYVNMENLFNGDKALGDNMNAFLNENWEDVFKELGPVIAEIMRSVINGILEPFFNLVSYNDAFV